MTEITLGVRWAHGNLANDMYCDTANAIFMKQNIFIDTELASWAGEAKIPSYTTVAKLIAAYKSNQKAPKS